MKLPAYDLIPRVSKFCFEEWQNIWICCPGNILHAIYPVVVTAQHNKISSRREAVIINRFQLGHCRLTQTHSYLMSGEAERHLKQESGTESWPVYLAPLKLGFKLLGLVRLALICQFQAPNCVLGQIRGRRR